MAKINPKSKRQKKKQDKKRLVEVSRERNLSNKPQKQTVSELQKQVKKSDFSIARKERREQRKNYAMSLGLPESIISKNRLYDTSEKNIKTFANSYNRKKNAESRYNRKVQRLISEGWKEDKARAFVGTVSNQKTNKDIDSIINRRKNLELDKAVLTLNKWLYIGYSDYEGYGFYMDRLETEEAERMLLERIGEEDYQFRGAFVYNYGSQKAMETMAYVYYQRSVNFSNAHPKFDGKQYHKITVSNKWSRYEFINMVNSIAQQMNNDDLIPFLNKMKDYCRVTGASFLSFLPNLKKY